MERKKRLINEGSKNSNAEESNDADNDDMNEWKRVQNPCLYFYLLSATKLWLCLRVRTKAIINYIYMYNIYTGWLVTGGTSGKGVILREKRSRKYRIKMFRLRLCKFTWNTRIRKRQVNKIEWEWKKLKGPKNYESLIKLS